MHQLTFVTQLFYEKSRNELYIAAVKVVDHVSFPGELFEVKTVIYTPASFLFFGLYMVQDTEMEIFVYADDKLEA